MQKQKYTPRLHWRRYNHGYIDLCLRILLDAKEAEDRMWQDFRETDYARGEHKDALGIAIWVANYLWEDYND